MDMGSYYNFREKIKTLYNNSFPNSTDLCGKLLELKDKNKNIIGMDIRLSQYCIEIDVDDNITLVEKQKIADSAMRRIGYYISSNSNYLNIPENDRYSFDSFLGSVPYLYCDYTVIGNTITINL